MKTTSKAAEEKCDSTENFIKNGLGYFKIDVISACAQCEGDHKCSQ